MDVAFARSAQLHPHDFTCAHGVDDTTYADPILVYTPYHRVPVFSQINTI